MQGLKDIKGLVEVPDYSLWILLSIVIFVIFFIILIIYLYKNKRRRKKKLTFEQIARKNLKEIDFSNTKNTVYTFSENFQYFINEENKEAFKKLQKELEAYKYKKDIDELPSKLEENIKELIKEIK